MKALPLAVLLFFSSPLFALIEVGQSVPNFCWPDAEDRTICLDDYKNTVRVLVYNTGWCEPANTHMKELASSVGGFIGKPVTFLSLSAQGWTHGSAPNATFLKEWQAKHQIPFVVAGSPGDAGKNFFMPIYVPNIAVVDKGGKLAYKEIMPANEVLFREIDRLLQQMRPSTP